MNEPRRSILTALAAGRELESELLRACDDSTPDQPGGWTARDHLAHLARWREHAAAVLDAARTGAPAPVVPDEDERNAEIYAETHGLAASEVTGRAAASYDRLLAAIEACSDEDLLKPRRPDSDAPVWGVVPGNGETHAAQHLVYWHRGRGDHEAAERVARRLHAIETEAFTDRGMRAAATYNLGCFYATAGRPDEALDLVRQALALDPGLRDWAMQDGDLESIRPRLATA